jgi:hypothetical protein
VGRARDRYRYRYRMLRGEGGGIISRRAEGCIIVLINIHVLVHDFTTFMVVYVKRVPLRCEGVRGDRQAETARYLTTKNMKLHERLGCHFTAANFYAEKTAHYPLATEHCPKGWSQTDRTVMMQNQTLLMDKLAQNVTIRSQF